MFQALSVIQRFVFHRDSVLLKYYVMNLAVAGLFSFKTELDLLMYRLLK